MELKNTRGVPNYVVFSHKTTLLFISKCN